MFAIWPYVKRRLDPQLTATRRILLGCAVFAALLAPDSDVLMGLVYPSASIMDYHNGPTHSLLVGVVFALLFGGVCWIIIRGRWLPFTLVGVLCYTSHVLLDWLTWGRGVQLFWPVSEARFQAPFPLFMGVRHSVGAPFSTHMLTGANDLMFGVAVWLVSRWAWSRHARRTRPAI